MSRLKEALGLDWQPGSVRIARAERRGGGLLFETLTVAPVPDDVHEAAARVRSALEARGWDNVSCAANLPDRYVMLRLLETQEGEGRALAEIAGEQTETLKGLAEDQAFSALHPLPRDGRTMRALYALSRADRIRAALDLADQSGLETTALVPDPLAALELAVHLVEPIRDAPLAVLYIGPDSTDLAAGPPGSVCLLRRLAAGARELQQPDRSFAALQTWFAEIQRAMSGPPGETVVRPARLLVCGHMVLPDEGLQRLEQMLGIPCRHLHSLMADRFPAGGDAAMAVAAGLALIAMGDRDGKVFNLLPDDRKRRHAGRRQIPYWLGAGAVASLAVVLWAYGLGREIDRQEGWQERIATAEARIRLVEGQLSALKDFNGRLQAQIRSLDVPARNAELARSAAQALADAMHTNDWIVLLADAPSYTKPPGVTNDAATPATPAFVPTNGLSGVESGGFRQFVAEGLTPVEDLSTVRAMIEKLRRHPIVRSADVLPDDRVRPDEERDKRWLKPGLRLFAIEITVVSG